VDLSDRKALLGCFGGALALLLLLAGGGFVAYKQAIEPNLPVISPPPSLEAEGPSTGEDLFVHAIFLQDRRLGGVSDIAVGDLDHRAGTEVVVAGVHGAAVIEDERRKYALIPYALDPDRDYARLVEVVDVDGDGECEFLANELHDAGGPVVLMDHTGQVIWESGDVPPSLSAGDVDGDGELEFAGRIDQSVALVETDGTVVWRREIPHAGSVAMADVDGDGLAEIIYFVVKPEEAQVVVTGRDDSGEVVYEATRKQHWATGGFADSFTVCPWPEHGEAAHILTPASRHLVLANLEGGTVIRGSAPGTNIVDYVWGTPVSRGPGTEPYLASLTYSMKFEASFLRLHDAEGSLLFERATSLNDDDALWPGLAAWQPPGEDHEVLLVGGNGKVWRYEMANSAPTSTQ